MEGEGYDFHQANLKDESALIQLISKINLMLWLMVNQSVHLGDEPFLDFIPDFSQPMEHWQEEQFTQ
jgi:hypothetical protein